jgi:hypothetical protein
MCYEQIRIDVLQIKILIIKFVTITFKFMDIIADIS